MKIWLELLRDGFGGDPCFKVILAELSKPPEPGPELEAESPENPLPLSASMQKDERVVGYALYFFNYSTWEGRGIYLEDLYIRKEYRSWFHFFTHLLQMATLLCML